MIRVGNNYRSKFLDNSGEILCPLCKNREDTQEHLLECPKLVNDGPSVRYSNIFANNSREMKDCFEALKTALNKREDLIAATD